MTPLPCSVCGAPAGRSPGVPAPLCLPCLSARFEVVRPCSPPLSLAPTEVRPLAAPPCPAGCGLDVPASRLRAHAVHAGDPAHLALEVMSS